MYRMIRCVLAGATASLLCLVTVGAAAATTAGGIKGDPQPELKPFQIGTAISGGSVAIEPDGTLVTVFDIKSGTTGKTEVCVLNRGARTCSKSVALSPLSGDDLFGTPQVFAPSAGHIVVLQWTCCDTNPSGGDLLYTSADGGATFGPPVRVGSLSVAAAALIGSDIIFSEGDTNSGATVESIPVTATAPPASTAIATAKPAFDIGDGTYKGGALVASDDLGTDYTSYVAYAPAGKDFNSSASYHNVGMFPHEQLVAISGGALLTIQTTGKQALELRLFNGTAFGSAHVVPNSGGGGPGWFTINQDPSGKVHVFSEDSRSAKIYHLYEASTSTGTTWSKPQDLGNAIQDNGFAAALDSSGTGLVLGTDPAWMYSVLSSQSVTLTLSPATIKTGQTSTASGKATPSAAGRKVELQIEKSGLWSTVATTTEGSGGSFTFKIKGTTTGTFSYRAETSDKPGYLQFGYSSAKPLKVTG
ncbi:MAG TPA: hypothetical protein VGI74_20710 [Streptosporangiaceae bacterium]